MEDDELTLRDVLNLVYARSVRESDPAKIADNVLSYSPTVRAKGRLLFY
jgi:hypothetical protein